MSAYAFGLKTPREFLEKARREIRRMESWASREDVADAAINAAVTLWSLNEWISRSKSADCVAAIARIKTENQSAKAKPKQILHEHIEKDRNIRLCRDVANGVKHFELREDEPIGDTTVSAVTKPFLLSDVRVPRFSAKVLQFADPGVEETTASLMPSLTAAMPTSYIAKIILEDGTRLSAADVFRGVVRYWEEFFRIHKL